MSIWTERVANHEVWAALEALAADIAKAAERESASAQTVAGLERVRAVQDFVAQRLASVDQVLLVPSHLDSLCNHIGQASAELRAFVTDGNEARVATTNAHIDNVISALMVVPVVVSGTEVRTLGRASADYRRATETALEETEHQASRVRDALTQSEERLRAVEKDIVGWKERVEKQVSEWQSQFSASQDSRASEFGNGQSAREERFSATVGAFQEKATQQIAELEKLRVTLKAEAEAGIDALSADFGMRATSLLAEMEDQKVAVEKLVGVIGNLGVTSGYQTTANVARGEKQLWQAITVVAFIAFIAFAWDAFLPVIGDEFSWPSFAGRALLTVAVGLFAAYAAKQGDKAAQSEAHNRAMALELEALGPYIAPLPIEEQRRFRIDIGKNAFGSGRAVAEAQGERSPTGVLDLLREGRLEAFVTNIIKAARDK